MKVLLGADLGTSAFKAVAIAVDGRILASGRVATAYRRPAPGRVQFSVPEQFARLGRLLRKVVTALPPGAQPVALALSGAGGSVVLLDGRQRPLAPAISWLDTRAGDDFPALLPQLTREEVREVVGWPWTKRFPLTQLAWLRRHRPAAYRKARYVALDLACYYQGLTGRLAVDHSSATTFYLQDQKRRCWHAPFLRALEIAESALPELVAPGTRVGGLTAKAARALGLPAGLPVVAGCFDHPSAALGTGATQPGDLLLSCGTSWVGFCPIADRAAALAGGLITDPFRQPEGPWGAMFSLTAVGTTIDRYLTEIFPLPKTLTLAQRYRRFTAAATTVPGGGEGLPIDPLAPFPSGRAERARLCAGSSLGQLSRRLMVGTALAMRRRLAAIKIDGFKPRRLIMVGGPATSEVWTQIVADSLGRELLIAGAAAAGAVGAALQAGIGVGVYRHADEAVRRTQPALRPVVPVPAHRAWYARFE